MTLYPSSNQYGIPDLQLDDLGVGLPSPVLPWGATKRSALQRGTWHHYVDDYRFGGLWFDPDQPLRTECAGIVEPNYSVTPETPLAECLWHTYRKRWMARHWQSAGVQVWVDLYVDGPTNREANLIGVPAGWQRFATVGTTCEALHADLATARSFHLDAVLMVYAGPSDVAAEARKLGALHIPRGRR
jgi:hypothetical protein